MFADHLRSHFRAGGTHPLMHGNEATHNIKTLDRTIVPHNRDAILIKSVRIALVVAGTNALPCLSIKHPVLVIPTRVVCFKAETHLNGILIEDCANL